jgi:anthranilate/para-aminobenzoate synthase component II
LVEHCGESFFRGVPSPFRAGRYHSLVAQSVPDVLRVTARSGSMVMAVEHRTLPVAGVQFHPESILTPLGGLLLDGILEWARSSVRSEVLNGP